MPVVSGVEAGGTQALGHHVHKDDTCWPDKQGLEKWEKALGSDQLPTHRAADGQGENTTTSPSETAAGKCLCREEHGEQPLRHRDVNRIWEYLCLGGTAPARGKENSNCGVQRAQSLIICFSIAWRAAERGEERQRNSFPPTLQKLFNMTSSSSGPRTPSSWNLASPEEEKIAMLPSCFSSNKQRSGLGAALGHLSFIQQGQMAPEAGPGRCPEPARMGKKRSLYK